MEYYDPATICINGHVISSTQANSTKYCQRCGANTVSQCANCNIYIRGEYNIVDMPYISEYERPFYCFDCGDPFPWTKQILENAVELVDLDEELTNEIKDIIKSSLPNLLIETPTTPVAVAKYRKFMGSASTFVKDGMKNLLIGAVNESVKKSIWG